MLTPNGFCCYITEEKNSGWVCVLVNTGGQEAEKDQDVQRSVDGGNKVEAILCSRHLGFLRKSPIWLPGTRGEGLWFNRNTHKDSQTLRGLSCTFSVYWCSAGQLVLGFSGDGTERSFLAGCILESQLKQKPPAPMLLFLYILILIQQQDKLCRSLGYLLCRR